MELPVFLQVGDNKYWERRVLQDFKNHLGTSVLKKSIINIFIRIALGRLVFLDTNLREGPRSGKVYRV